MTTLTAGIAEVTKAWVRWVDDHPEAAAVVDHVNLVSDFGDDHRNHIMVYIADDLGQPAVDLVAESLGIQKDDGFVPPKYAGTEYRQWALYGALFSAHAVVGRKKVCVDALRGE
jgi:hypothetical protein